MNPVGDHSIVGSRKKRTPMDSQKSTVLVNYLINNLMARITIVLGSRDLLF